jgi:two-component system nitrogen regulation response regulator NtrX
MTSAENREDASRPAILIVDDDPHMLNLARMFLEADNFSIDAVKSPRLALQRLEQRSYDIVLCDVQMPEIDGHELLKRTLSSIRPDQVIIMMTAHGAGSETEKLIAEGAWDIVPKPFTSERLRLSIRNALRFKLLSDELALLRRQYPEAN